MKKLYLVASIASLAIVIASAGFMEIAVSRYLQAEYSEALISNLNDSADVEARIESMLAGNVDKYLIESILRIMDSRRETNVSLSVALEKLVKELKSSSLREVFLWLGYIVIFSVSAPYCIKKYKAA
ncbi:MAG: hypothetical protein LC646_09050 [Xanthomonadaceae bacterium]|nr:hypothetical protein [Xanthomonadaceae bacterium]